MRKFIYILIFLVLSIFVNSFGQVAAFKDHAIFKFSNGVKLHLFASVFDSTEHFIKRCKNFDWSCICLIDDNPVFGTDCDMPRSVLKGAYLEVNNKKIELKVTCMYNPWFGKPQKRFFYIEKQGREDWLIDGYLSDAAGSYVVEWKVVAGVSIRTILSDDEEIILRILKKLNLDK